MKKSSLKKNFIYNILYQLLILIIPLITSPYLTRTIGAEGLGIYTVSQAFANYFTLFILLGLNNYGNREIAKCRDDRKLVSKTFWEIYLFQLFMLIIVSTLYIFIVCFFIHEDKLIYFLQFIYVISAGLDINWCCFGLEKFKLTVTRNAAIKIASAIFIFIYVKSSDDLWLYTVIMTVSLFVSQAILWPFVLKDIDFVKPLKKEILKHVKYNVILFLPVIAVSIYTVMDKLMIGMIDSKEEVAYYTYALRFIDIPQTVIIALSTVMLPRVSNMIATGHSEETYQLLEKTMKYMMFFTIGAAFIITSVSYELIPWYYGESFRRCALFAIWLSPYIVLGGWNGTIRSQFIIPNGYDYIYLITVSSGAVTNLILNAVLIPNYRGIGAVWATIAAQFMVCFMQYMLTKKFIDFSPFFKNILLFLVCGIVMMIALYLYPGYGSPIIDSLIKVLIGLSVYSLLSIGYLYLVKKDSDILNLMNRFKITIK